MALIEIGKYNKLPHYELIGKGTDFYVWINEDGRGESSKWIKGRTASKEYYKIKNEKDKNKQIQMIKELYARYEKITH
jgi:hypothetical protein